MKRLLVDKNLHPSSKSLLVKNGFELLETVKIPQIDNSTSTHPDMQFLKTEESTAIVCSELFDYYQKLIPDYSLKVFDKIGSKYPYDCLLNIVSLKNNIILTKLQSEYLKEQDFKNIIFVNQGYVKCNICTLNSNTVLTSDNGIAKKLENFGFKVYLLPCNQIKLKGYKNGFWGGCTGNISDGVVYFNGDITRLDCYGDLKNILKKEKIEPLYNSEIELTDNGSIINID